MGDRRTSYRERERDREQSFLGKKKTVVYYWLLRPAAWYVLITQSSVGQRDKRAGPNSGAEK